MPTSLCNSATLAGPEYFGQYGTIIHIVAKHRNDKTPKEMRECEFTNYENYAYIKYEHKHEALLAICAIEATLIKACPNVKATIGSTKFCKKLIKKGLCDAKNCPFYHEYTSPELMIYCEKEPLEPAFIKSQVTNIFSIIMNEYADLIAKEDEISENKCNLVNQILPGLDKGLEFVKYLNRNYKNVPCFKVLRESYRHSMSTADYIESMKNGKIKPDDDDLDYPGVDGANINNKAKLNNKWKTGGPQKKCETTPMNH